MAIQPRIWKSFEDAWTGAAWEAPEGWTCISREGFRLVSSPEGDSAALIWPDPGPGSLETVLQHVLKSLAGGEALQAWASPEEPLPGGGFRKLMAFERSQRLRGHLEALGSPQGSVLVRGWQAPRDSMGEMRPILERILQSFRPVTPLARRRYVDPSEGAWSVLVPEGWQPSGRVDRSGGQMAIRWAVEDPATGARAFNDGLIIPFQSGFFGGLPYAAAVDFCQGWLFQAARQQRPDLRLLEVRPDPALEAASRESLRPVAMQFGGQPQVSGALATSSYTEGRRSFKEVLAVTTWALHPSAPQWFASLGPGLRAPVEHFDSLERVLAGIVLSYQANQAWESQEMTAQGRRMAEERNQAERHRAQLWRETQDYCQRIDREIQEGHATTNAEIARGSYNLIAGKEDVLGEGHHSYKVDTGYDQYWQKDDRIMGSNSTDFDTHLQANGWKKMRVF